MTRHPLPRTAVKPRHPPRHPHLPSRSYRVRPPRASRSPRSIGEKIQSATAPAPGGTPPPRAAPTTPGRPTRHLQRRAAVPPSAVRPRPGRRRRHPAPPWPRRRVADAPLATSPPDASDHLPTRSFVPRASHRAFLLRLLVRRSILLLVNAVSRRRTGREGHRPPRSPRRSSGVSGGCSHFRFRIRRRARGFRVSSVATRGVVPYLRGRACSRSAFRSLRVVVDGWIWSVAVGWDGVRHVGARTAWPRFIFFFRVRDR